MENNWKNDFSKEQFNELCKKYILPKNCNLNVSTVNVEIWNLLSKYQKREDLKFQKLQKTIVKTVSANIELMNEIIEKPNNVNTQKVAQIISDSTALLGNVARETSIKRRFFIRNIFKDEYKDICLKSTEI